MVLFGMAVVIVLGAVMRTSEGRSIGEAAANYQDYAEQQDYAAQQEVDRSVRSIQDAGVDSYQPQKEFVREEANPNDGGAAYQNRENGDDEDLEQQPANNMVGMDGRAEDERGVKKDEAVDADVAEQQEIAEQQEVAEREAADQRDVAEPRGVAEQRDDSVHQNTNLGPVEAGRGGDASNFRPPRDDRAIQPLQKASRTEVARKKAGEVAFEEPADRPVNGAPYTGAEQEHSYNYNYVPEQAVAAEGPEQQEVPDANEENVPPAVYDQAAHEEAGN